MDQSLTAVSIGALFSEDVVQAVEERFNNTLVPFDQRKLVIQNKKLSIGDEITKGAFGTVYKASLDGEEIAIKMETITTYQTGELINLMSELCFLHQSTSHDNIVRFIGAGFLKEGSNSKILIALEYCEHGSLQRTLQHVKSWGLRLRMALGVAHALSYLHSMHIIHRDVKSVNILVAHGYKTKLCDFSFSCHKDSSSKDLTTYGTEEYMSPEVALALNYGVEADIFSYGIVLCEMITGRVPSEKFLHRQPRHSFALDIDELRVAVIEDCPDGLEALTYQCCESEPHKRPTADKCIVEIESILQELGFDVDGDDVEEVLSGILSHTPSFYLSSAGKSNKLLKRSPSPAASTNVITSITTTPIKRSSNNGTAVSAQASTKLAAVAAVSVGGGSESKIENDHISESFDTIVKATSTDGIDGMMQSKSPALSVVSWRGGASRAAKEEEKDEGGGEGPQVEENTSTADDDGMLFAHSAGSHGNTNYLSSSPVSYDSLADEIWDPAGDSIKSRGCKSTAAAAAAAVAAAAKTKLKILTRNTKDASVKPVVVAVDLESILSAQESTPLPPLPSTAAASAPTAASLTRPFSNSVPVPAPVNNELLEMKERVAHLQNIVETLLMEKEKAALEKERAELEKERAELESAKKKQQKEQQQQQQQQEERTPPSPPPPPPSPPPSRSPVLGDDYKENGKQREEEEKDDDDDDEVVDPKQRLRAAVGTFHNASCAGNNHTTTTSNSSSKTNNTPEAEVKLTSRSRSRSSSPTSMLESGSVPGPDHKHTGAAPTPQVYGVRRLYMVDPADDYHALDNMGLPAPVRLSPRLSPTGTAAAAAAFASSASSSSSSLASPLPHVPTEKLPQLYASGSYSGGRGGSGSKARPNHYPSQSLAQSQDSGHLDALHYRRNSHLAVAPLEVSDRLSPAAWSAPRHDSSPSLSPPKAPPAAAAFAADGGVLGASIKLRENLKMLDYAFTVQQKATLKAVADAVTASHEQEREEKEREQADKERKAAANKGLPEWYKLGMSRTIQEYREENNSSDSSSAARQRQQQQSSLHNGCGQEQYIINENIDHEDDNGECDDNYLNNALNVSQLNDSLVQNMTAAGGSTNAPPPPPSSSVAAAAAAVAVSSAATQRAENLCNALTSFLTVIESCESTACAARKMVVDMDRRMGNSDCTIINHHGDVTRPDRGRKVLPTPLFTEDSGRGATTTTAAAACDVPRNTQLQQQQQHPSHIRSTHRGTDGNYSRYSGDDVSPTSSRMGAQQKAPVPWYDRRSASPRKTPVPVQKHPTARNRSNSPTNSHIYNSPQQDQEKDDDDDAAAWFTTAGSGSGMSGMSSSGLLRRSFDHQHQQRQSRIGSVISMGSSDRDNNNINSSRRNHKSGASPGSVSASSGSGGSQFNDNSMSQSYRSGLPSRQPRSRSPARHIRQPVRKEPLSTRAQSPAFNFSRNPVVRSGVDMSPKFDRGRRRQPAVAAPSNLRDILY